MTFKPRTTRDNATRFACWLCGALPGECCTTRDGQARYQAHSIRHERACALFNRQGSWAGAYHEEADRVSMTVPLPVAPLPGHRARTP